MGCFNKSHSDPLRWSSPLSIKEEHKTYTVLHFASTTSSPARIQCLGQGDFESLVRALFHIVCRDLAAGLCPESTLPRAVVEVVAKESSKDTEHIIACQSHEESFFYSCG
jgi:hypothetical protein